MNKEHEDTGQFKMKLDDLNEDVDNQSIPLEVNELKLEKISQRVTLISIIIPVLIVVIVVVTYLDIKKRVLRTEDTGTIEFQKLSSDLESRFSTLSVRQAKMEEDLAKQTDDYNHAMAQLQVRLEKFQDKIKAIQSGTVGEKQLSQTKTELTQQLNTVVSSANEASEQFAAIAETMKSQMDEMKEANSAAQEKITRLETELETLQVEKIDKPALDLAIRLEGLKIGSQLKSEIEALQSKVQSLEADLSKVSRKQQASPPPAKTTGQSQTQSTPAKPANSSPGIKEQSIPK